MRDLIYRQAAIDAMMKLQAEDEELYGCRIPEGFDGDRAKETLEQLPSAQQWIPCSERLPEENGDYLVTIKLYASNICSVIGYANDLYKVDEYDFHDKKGVSGWFFYDSEYGFGEETNVIAWMPLPTPYREGKDD